MKKTTATLLIALLAGLFLIISCKTKTDVSCSSSNVEYNSVLLEKPDSFHKRPDAYLDWQSKQLLNAIDSILHTHKPQIKEPYERHLAMLIMDAVLHDIDAPHRKSVQSFYHNRISLVLEQLQNEQIASGMKVWKLYNMATIMRTESITIAFDITKAGSAGADGFMLSDEVIEKIANESDALFITHYHRDHADEEVAKTFIKLGKPVVAPPDIWKEKEIYNEITHMDRKAHEIQKLRLDKKEMDLNVVVYPGHQGADILNNVILIYTPEGYTLCHTGDQSFKADFDWIDDVHVHHKIDILIPNCWTTDPPRAARGFHPHLIIPAHENELGHTIDHREAYTLNYSKWNVPYNKIIMTWGESFHYK